MSGQVFWSYPPKLKSGIKGVGTFRNESKWESPLILHSWILLQECFYSAQGENTVVLSVHLVLNYNDGNPASDKAIIAI